MQGVELSFVVLAGHQRLMFWPSKAIVHAGAQGFRGLPRPGPVLIIKPVRQARMSNHASRQNEGVEKKWWALKPACAVVLWEKNCREDLIKGPNLCSCTNVKSSYNYLL